MNTVTSIEPAVNVALDFLLFADFITQDKTQKLVMVGEYDTVSVPSVPANHTPFHMVARVRHLDPHQAGQYVVSFCVLDPSGATVVQPKPVPVVLRPSSLFPGKPAHVNLIMQFTQLPLTTAGRYTIKASANDVVIGESELWVRVHSPNQTAESVAAEVRNARRNG